MTYAVIVGEDDTNSDNTVYFTSGATGRYYDAETKEYYVTYNAIQGGEQIVLKVLDDEATDEDPGIGGLFKATFNKDGYVKALDKMNPSTKMTTTDNKAAGYTLTGGAKSTDAITLELKGATLWVKNVKADDNYVVIDDDCKIFVHTYNDDDDEYVEYNTLESAIGALTTEEVNGQTVAYVKEVATICNKTTGYATTLIINEVKGTTTVVKPSDPATKPEATIVGYTISIPSVNGAPVDTVQGVLEKNGYKLESMQNGACVATKDGVTYYFTINTSDAYYTTTVDGVVVEYKKANAQGTVTAEKAFAGKVGTSYKWTASNGQSGFGTYASAKSAGKIDGITGAAVEIETGYVALAAASGTTGVSVPGYAKANSTATVTVTKTPAPAADTTLAVTYASSKTTAAQAGDGKKTEFTFTIETATADIKDINVKSVETYKMIYSKVDPKNGISMVLEGPAKVEKAASGDTVVTVTATISGTASSDAEFTISGANWDSGKQITGKVEFASNKVTVKSGTYLSDYSVTFQLKVTANPTTVSAS